jgi:hypothetical protein
MFKSNGRLTRCRISTAALLFAAIAGIANCGGAPEDRVERAQQGRLEGDVFIVTRGATNVKLGLVEIQVLRPEEAISSIAQTKATVEREMAKIQPQLDVARIGFSSASARYLKESKLADDFYLKRDLYNWSEAMHAQDLAKKEVTSARPRLAELEEQAERWNSAALYLACLPSPIASAKTDADGKFSIMLKSKAAVAVAAHATRMVGDKVENYEWIISVSLDGQPSKRIFLSNDNLVTSGSIDSLVHVGE